jgi:hypothetical protein
VLLKSTGNTGTGMMAETTWVHRLNTTGGVGPSGSCDPTVDAGRVVSVPYTADYFFYLGGRIQDAGSDASDDGSADSGG